MSCTKATTRTDSPMRFMGDLCRQRPRVQGRGLPDGWIGVRVRTIPTQSICSIVGTRYWQRISPIQRTSINALRTTKCLLRSGRKGGVNGSAVFQETFTLVKAMGGPLGSGVVPVGRTTSRSTKEPGDLLT